MNKNLSIEQVLRKKERIGTNIRECSWFIDELDKLKHGKDDDKLYAFVDFIPVRIVTFVEFIVRHAVKQLIDKGDPYFSNAENYLKNLKSDHIKAIHGKIVTVGDIIANSLSINSLDQLVSIFDQIVGKGFKSELSKIPSRIAQVLYNNNNPIVEDIDSVFSAVAHIFELRHRIVHEAYCCNSKFDVKRNIIFAQQFIAALYEYIDKRLLGEYPVTQEQMLQYTHSENRNVRNELAKFIKEARSRSFFDRKSFYIVQKAWKEFCLAEATFEAEESEGGSNQRCIFISRLNELINERTIWLQNWLQRNSELL